MPNPKPFQWDFDQKPLEEVGRYDHHSVGSVQFETFSVGVYQWLPQSSGKGVKKSRTIRVKGYVADPERVFKKAAELCRRLNKEGARAENPPQWLQKQYSVPKPPDLVRERNSSDLTGGQMRSARLKIMKQILLPQGFVKANDGAYVRKKWNEVHLIDFQPHSRGHEYTVNLGFHYDFVPGFFCRKKINLSACHLLDCALQTRIGAFVAGGRDIWFEYGSSLKGAKATLAQNANDCLGVFDEYAEKWRQPEWWLASATPRVNMPAKRILPWRTDYLPLFVACIALHLGKTALATAKLKLLLAGAERDTDRRFLNTLLKKAGSK